MATIPSEARSQLPDTGSGTIDVAAYQILGRRSEQQDRYSIQSIPTPSGPVILIAVYDGHGDHGAFVAQAAATHIPKLLTEALSGVSRVTATHIATALRNAFIAFDNELASNDKAVDSGTTAVCVIITPMHYITANVGDSRAVLLRRRVGTTILAQLAAKGASKSSASLTLTTDHDSANASEVARATVAGATMDSEYFEYNDGGLQVSRAFGDYEMKMGAPPVVLAVPSIRVVRRSPEDVYLWLFSDGVVEALLNYDHSWCIDLLSDHISRGITDVAALAKMVTLDAYNNAGGMAGGVQKPVSEAGECSTDNITVVFAHLPVVAMAPKLGGLRKVGAVTKRRSRRLRVAVRGVTMMAKHGTGVDHKHES